MLAQLPSGPATCVQAIALSCPGEPQHGPPVNYLQHHNAAATRSNAAWSSYAAMLTSGGEHHAGNTPKDICDA